MKKRLVRLGIVILAAFGLLTGSALAAQAFQSAHRFTCGQRTVCFWTGSNETGTKYPIDVSGCPGSGLCGTWLNIPGKGSMWNNTGSSVKVWSDLEHSGQCVTPGLVRNLDNEFGYFYVKYGSSNCTGIPDHN